MAINEVFPNPTVKNVIFQIRYPNLFYLENKIGDIQLKLMKEFPESSLLYRQKILLADIGPEVEIKKEFNNKPEEAARKIWQFESPKKYKLNILNDSLDISSEFHKTYNNLKSDVRFRDIIELVLNSFLEVIQIPIVKRIGLRYIDECPLPTKTNEAFKKYYKTTFPLSRFKLEDAKEMQFRTVVSKGNHFLRFVESLAVVKNEYKLILDFDGYSENIKPEDCLQVSDNLHDLISKEYEESLRDPVYVYMRKKTVEKNGRSEQSDKK
jgi:uncharacterized protein (TIGR04255 family)